jgi:hypothetical protein
MKVNEKISKRMFKDKIKLNDEVERKLQKIIDMRRNGTNHINK